ncbi:rhomboid family intramembrane serine protease [Chloroflexota bacterium]
MKRNALRYRIFKLTPVLSLITLNILVYILTLIAPGLIFRLGLQPTIFFEQPWTILTNLFTHASLWHVSANMLTFYFFGRYLSHLIGETKLLVIYFGGGILGNILFILWALLPFTSPFVIGIGASGAVFALGGTLTALRPKLKVLVFPIPVPLPLWTAVIGGFLIISFLPNISWQAHLGGLIFGLLTGYYLKKKGRFFF